MGCKVLLLNSVSVPSQVGLVEVEEPMDVVLMVVAGKEEGEAEVEDEGGTHLRVVITRELSTTAEISMSCSTNKLPRPQNKKKTATCCIIKCSL